MSTKAQVSTQIYRENDHVVKATTAISIIAKMTKVLRISLIQTKMFYGKNNVVISLNTNKHNKQQATNVVLSNLVFVEYQQMHHGYLLIKIKSPLLYTWK